MVLPLNLVVEMQIGPATWGFRPVKDAPVPIQGKDEFGLEVGRHVKVANYPLIVNNPAYAAWNTADFTQDGGCRVIEVLGDLPPLKNPLPLGPGWGDSARMSLSEWETFKMLNPYQHRWWLRWNDLVPVEVIEPESRMNMVVDCWEGTETLDTQLLLDAGVIGLIVRLNDMNGGHHRDINFNAQWIEAQKFPASTFYFVYNPWVNGKVNADWLKANAPSNSPKKVAIDFELSMPGKSASVLTVEFTEFLSLIKPFWIPWIYTGGGYTNLLTQWPKDLEYWWARYPYSIQGDQSYITTTWEVIESKLIALGWNPDPTGKSPVPPNLWQATSRYILPGSNGNPVDLNIWPKTVGEWKNWIEAKVSPVLTYEQKVDKLWAAHPELW